MMQSIRVSANRVAIFLLAALVLTGAAAWFGAGAISTVQAAGIPSITSDKLDYHPGETVTLTGAGWQPGEAVTVTMTVSPLTHSLVTLTGLADGTGNFTINSYVVQQSDLGVTFTVIATGDKGSLARTTFTDSETLTVAISPTGGGTVVSTPSGLNCPTTCGSVNFSSGTAVSIQATAASGFVFSSWTVTGTAIGSGNCTTGSTSNPCTFTAQSGGHTTTLTANFVVPVSTTTIITSSLNPSAFGQSVVFTADVAPASGSTAPTGAVQFVVDATNLGSAVTLTTGGSCPATHACATSTATTTISVGNHTVTANYTGTNGFGNSSATVSGGQTVNQAVTTAGVASSLNPSNFNQSVTFTATVSTSPGGTPTGTVAIQDNGTTICTTGNLSGSAGTATASCAVSTLAAATPHSITAVYAGNTNFAGITSDPLSQTVNALTTTTGLVSSLPAGSTFGQSVTFTATVTPNPGVTTNSVTFYDGATPLGTVSTLSTGVATLAYSALDAATHSITAVFAGNTNYLTSTSSAVSQLVNMSNTTVTVATSGTPSSLGATVTFTATIHVTAPGSGVPLVGGSVTFFDNGIGGTNLGTVLTDGTTNQVTLPVSTLGVGTHHISAIFGGDTNLNGSPFSPAITQIVSIVPAVTLNSSANPSAYGGSVIFSATVTPTPTDGDVVTFMDGATQIGTGTTTSGIASFTDATMTVSLSPHSITAMFSGDANVPAATSPVLFQTVNVANTATVLTSAVNPTMFGQATIFTATTTGAAPGGLAPSAEKVLYFDSLVSVPHNWRNTWTSGTDYAVNDAVLDSANGSSYVALFALTNDTTPPDQDPGNWTLITQPEYNWRNTWTSGTNYAVNNAVYDSANGSSYVAVSALPNDTTPPDQDPGNWTLIAQPALTWQSTWDTTDAYVVNDAVYNPATLSYFIAINPSGPGGLSPDTDPTNWAPLTLVGTKTTSGAGVAAFNFSSLALGPHTITAVYDPTLQTTADTNYTASQSSVIRQVVNQANSNVVVSSTPLNSSVFGQPVTIKATVTAASPGNGIAGPNETVTFMDGATSLGTALTDNSGVATLPAIANFSVMTHSITAIYGDDLNLLPGTSLPYSLVVNPAPTTTSVVTSGTPTQFGDSVTFTATIAVPAPGAGTPLPGDTVTFKDGATVLVPAATTDVTGLVATYTTSTLSVGTHNITAVFAGDTNYATSTSSPAVSQVVQKVSTTTTITTDLSAATVVGQPYTVAYTVVITSPHTGTIPDTDNVTVSDGSQTCTATVLAGSCQLTSTTAGAKTITATYAGNTNNASSVSTPGTAHTVSAASTTTTVSSSAAPSVYKQSVTLRATIAAVAPGGGTPTSAANNVQFFDGATSLGTATSNAVTGLATITTSALTLGSHDITAVYATNANYTTSTSAIFTQVVNQASTTTTVTSNQATPVTGQSVTFTATIAAVAPGTGLPTTGDTVTFYDNGTQIGTGTTNASGVATLAISTLSVAGSPHPITATFAGDTNYVTSTSVIFSQVVNKANTTTTVSTGTLGTSTVVGVAYPVAYTVTVVSPGTGAVTGTDLVTVSDGTDSCQGTVTAATCQLTSTTAGTKTITATYAGGASFNTSTSSGGGNKSHTVTKAGTTTSITTNLLASSTVVGQGYTVAFTVVVNAPGAGTIPGTDTVTVSDGTSTCSGTITAGFCTLTSTTAGLKSVTASFVTDANFAASTSGAASHTVTAAGTSTALTSSLTPSVFGQSVTFTATVTAVAPGGGTPTAATVTFVADGVTTLGTATSNGSGVATLNVTSLNVAGSPHSINAIYGGNSNYGLSQSSALSQGVTQANSTTALTSSPASTVVGQSITFTATVTATAPGGGTAGTGETVTFMDGPATLGTGTTNASGVATLAVTTLAFGPHSVTASYPGDANLLSSVSSAVSQTVVKSGTATYTQPFNASHGWTYTVAIACTETGGSGSGCSSNTNYTTSCATSPCVEASAASGSGSGGYQSGFFSAPGTLTWQSLGVPAGVTVTSVQGSFWDHATSCAAGTTAGLAITDAAGNYVLGSAFPGVALIPDLAVQGDTASAGVTHTSSTLAVRSTYQASSTTIILRLDLTPQSSGTFSTCALSGDTLTLTINYVTPGGVRGQVVISSNRTSDGPFGNMWSPKVEPTIE